jgi:hypothetical protein
VAALVVSAVTCGEIPFLSAMVTVVLLAPILSPWLGGSSTGSPSSVLADPRILRDIPLTAWNSFRLRYPIDAFHAAGRGRSSP